MQVYIYIYIVYTHSCMCSQHVQYTIFLTSAILGPACQCIHPFMLVCIVYVMYFCIDMVEAVFQPVYFSVFIHSTYCIIEGQSYICIFQCFFLCILVDCWHISGFGIGSDSFWWRACGTVQKLELMKYFWCRDKVRTVPSLRVVGSGEGDI